MKLLRPASIVSVVLAVILSAPVFAVSPDAHSALPGTLNYVEGQANIGTEALNGNSIGSATLQPGQILDTGNGKAEVLLTPGVFLRVDNESAVKMISPSITDTELALERGRAMVEVAEIHDQNNLRISEDGITTRLLKKGLYEFDADREQVLVFDGKAGVQDGDRTVEVKGGHELDLNASKLKPHSFNKSDYKESDLYQWSSLRSSYLSEANVETAPVYVDNGYYGPGWFGPGWYWAPGFGGYTFIPGDGIFYSPFGWRFYSPLVIYRSPWRYGYVHQPFLGRPGYVNGFTRGPQVYHGGPAVAPRSPAVTPRNPTASRSPVVHSGPAFHGGFSHGSFGGGHMTSTRR
jgi:hypothetical protein